MGLSKAEKSHSAKSILNCERVLKPNFVQALCKRTLAVSGDICKRSPISRLVYPKHASAATSCSRAVREFPDIPELVIGNVLGQAGGQQVRDQFIYRTALVLGKCGECSLQAFANLIRSGTGIRTQAYQGQQAIQDRHGGDYSRTRVLSQVRERNCLETVAQYSKITKKGNKNKPSTALSTPATAIY